MGEKPTGTERERERYGFVTVKVSHCSITSWKCATLSGSDNLIWREK